MAAFETMKKIRMLPLSEGQCTWIMQQQAFSRKNIKNEYFKGSYIWFILKHGDSQTCDVSTLRTVDKDGKQGWICNVGFSVLHKVFGLPVVSSHDANLSQIPRNIDCAKREKSVLQWRSLWDHQCAHNELSSHSLPKYLCLSFILATGCMYIVILFQYMLI